MTAKMSSAGERFLHLVAKGMTRQAAMEKTEVSERTSYRLMAKAKKKGKKTRESA